MTHPVDVAIIGGGAAGSATAIALQRAGQTTCVLERSQVEQPRIGETLAPPARNLLARLGVLERYNADEPIPSAGTLAAWGQPELAETHAISNPYGHGWHIDRRAFEAMLAGAAAESGAQVLRGAHALTWHPSADGGWQIEYVVGAEHGSQTTGDHHQSIDPTTAGEQCASRTRQTVHARFLVDAAGRPARVARRLGARRSAIDRLVGIAGFFVDPSARAEHDTRTLVEAAPDGWWYSAWLPGARLVVAYMTDADLLPRARAASQALWYERLAQTLHIRTRSNGCRLEAMRTLDARSHRLDPAHGSAVRRCLSVAPDGRSPCGAPWLAVGDAGLALDPLAARGLCHALESGLRAADAISSALRGDCAPTQAYSRWLAHTFDTYARRRLSYYAHEQRWPGSPFWRRRHAPPEVAAPAIPTARGMPITDAQGRSSGL